MSFAPASQAAVLALRTLFGEVRQMTRDVAPVLLLGVIPLVLAGDSPNKPKEAGVAKSIYEFTVKDIDGKDVSLAKYKGDVVLIVNTASL
jgi:hypothetical protein